jgi:DNA-binding NarL/FixJ family response regulator
VRIRPRPVTTTASGLADSEVVPVGSERPDHRAATSDLAHGNLRGVSVHAVPGFGRLTTRERQIVSRLLDGHRPPGIARALFLSQSTVRNHLASVFRKLGVTSQEGLLELFRMDAVRADRGSGADGDHGQVSRIS